MSTTVQEFNGGKTCGKRTIPESNTRCLNIKDHEGDDVSIVWNLNPSNKSTSDTLPPPFPYQVYLTTSARGVVEEPHFPAAFARSIEREIGGLSESNWQYHFEIYTRPLPNILACIAHQRKEIRHRNRNGIVPRLVSSWTTRNGEGYKGRIIVIDREDWADAGITLVSFDPAEYDMPSSFPAWHTASDGDIDIVKALRYRCRTLIRDRLNEWWTDAGHSWTEADLARRNEGAFSPALYPAVDPLAHHDAEHEEVHELDGTALPGPAAQQPTDEDQDDGTPRIIDTFDRKELFEREDELKHLQTESYSDTLGSHVTSVWSSKHSKLRPPFSFTLYLSFNMLPLHPKALFSCLNKGLISYEAWTLDVVSNMPSMDAAFQYHSRASAWRTSIRTAQTRRCMHSIVQRVASLKLPGELLEYIEDLLVPPEIPRYSSRPVRPFDDVFMYLDMDHISTGSLLIYSNPQAYWHSQNHSYWQLGFTELESMSNAPYGQAVFEEDVLRIRFLRFWHRVADELHILWSLCSPRCSSLEMSQMPRITLKLKMPEACVWRATGPQYINGYPDTEVFLHSEQPIVIHCTEMFSHDVWAECVEVVALGTGDVLPMRPYKYMDDSLPYDSWALSRELGGPSDAKIEQWQNYKQRTFEPGNSGVLGIVPRRFWWQDRLRNGMFRNGREYALRLKPGLTVPRWTYGEIGNLKGPYNLPPIPVTVDETIHKFKFRVESIGAPYGSFSRE